MAENVRVEREFCEVSCATMVTEGNIVGAGEIEQWTRRLSEYRHDLNEKLRKVDATRCSTRKEYRRLRQKIALIDGTFAEIADLLSVIPELR